MYGIVNKAIEDLIVEQFGIASWEAVRKHSEVEVDFFLSNESYDDAITYQLAGAVSEVMDMPLADVLIAFGEYWVLKTGKEKYGALMEAGGSNFKEFLINLPNFHNRVHLIYPNLQPPEFKITHIADRSLQLHYYSHRPGLTEFVRGLIQGLSKMYDHPAEIALLASRDSGSDHETFLISW